MKTKLSVFLLSIFFLSSCSKNNHSDEVNIRLLNTSAAKFENASFNNVNFGDIEPRSKTAYKVFENAYRVGIVNISINDEQYFWLPSDFIGEVPLENGYYTFEYSFDLVEKDLTDKLVKD